MHIPTAIRSLTIIAIEESLGSLERSMHCRLFRSGEHEVHKIGLVSRASFVLGAEGKVCSDKQIFVA